MNTETPAFVPLPPTWRLGSNGRVHDSPAWSEMIACMGGWCDRREMCAHYWAPVSEWRRPVERLCAVVRVSTDSQA